MGNDRELTIGSEISSCMGGPQWVTISYKRRCVVSDTVNAAHSPRSSPNKVLARRRVNPATRTAHQITNLDQPEETLRQDSHSLFCLWQLYLAPPNPKTKFSALRDSSHYLICLSQRFFHWFYMFGTRSIILSLTVSSP